MGLDSHNYYPRLRAGYRFRYYVTVTLGLRGEMDVLIYRR